MGVELGGGQAFVAQKLLHDAQIRTSLEEVRGVGVAKGVGVHVTTEYPFIEQATNVTGTQGGAALIEEQCVHW